MFLEVRMRKIYLWVYEEKLTLSGFFLLMWTYFKWQFSHGGTQRLSNRHRKDSSSFNRRTDEGQVLDINPSGGAIRTFRVRHKGQSQGIWNWSGRNQVLGGGNWIQYGLGRYLSMKEKKKKKKESHISTWPSFSEDLEVLPCRISHSLTECNRRAIPTDLLTEALKEKISFFVFLYYFLPRKARKNDLEINQSFFCVLCWWRKKSLRSLN